MKKYEKVKKDLIEYLSKYINKIEKADKISKICELIDTLDSELYDMFEVKIKNYLNDKYFETDKELDEFFNQPQADKSKLNRLKKDRLKK